MASITIRNLDEQTKRRLRIRAAQRNCSMEEEARNILCAALAQEPAPPRNLAQAIRARFEPIGGVELELPAWIDARSSPIRMTILDTNVLSEMMRETPDKRVQSWFSAQPALSLFTTSITQAEILRGLMLLPEGARRRALESEAEGMFCEDFAGRILSFGTETAPAYANIAVARHRSGRPISPFDAQIAAIARSTGATLATRNLKDFELCGIPLINPWAD